MTDNFKMCLELTEELEKHKKRINKYKQQLKVKEQECEDLKKQLIKCDDNIIVDCEYSKKDLCSFIHRKKEVINGLQQQLDQLREERDSYIDNYFLESQKVINLKKVLTEIKEIAERDKEFCIKCNGDKEIDCIECIEGGRALLAKDILQKISECEGNNG